jgi:hypothetical protein
MKHRVNLIACALLISAFAAPVVHADGRRSPVDRQHAAALLRSNVFANLGHEGSGRQSNSDANAFANLGHEGSGLVAAWEAAKIRPWAA